MKDDQLSADMKVVVIGASGLVGGALTAVGKDIGYNIIGTYNSNPVEGLVRLSFTDDVTGFLESHTPDIIMLPGAVTDVDWAESHSKETFACNVKPVKSIATYARASGSLVVFFSTDYVFDGKDGPYSEDAAKRPLSVYGRSKAMAEDVLERSSARYLVIRTTWVYGNEPRGKNYVSRLKRSLDARRPILAPVDQYGSPTHALDLARLTWLLTSSECTGIFNVAGPCLMDRWTFASMAASETRSDLSLVVRARTVELGQKALRPLKGGLLVHKVVSATGRVPQSVTSGLREMLHP